MDISPHGQVLVPARRKVLAKRNPPVPRRAIHTSNGYFVKLPGLYQECEIPIFPEWYWKVRARRGTKKALIGLARRILIIIYSSLKSGCLYSEEIIAKKPVAQIERRKQSLIRELKRLGVQVQLVEQNTTMPASA